MNECLVSVLEYHSLLMFFLFFLFMHILRLPTNRERQVINWWAQSLTIPSMGKAAF